jgi:hypothetical protein
MFEVNDRVYIFMANGSIKKYGRVSGFIRNYIKILFEDDSYDFINKDFVHKVKIATHEMIYNFPHDLV